MKKSTIILIIVLVVIAMPILTAISSYNGLVSGRESVNSALSQIDNQLQRRNDLIPNLVNTVKGYASHEKEIFENIANARASLMGATSMKDKSAADAQLTAGLGRLLAIAENYPTLKADGSFIRLQDELAGTENRIAVARKDYNDSARLYNTKIAKFPTVIFANMFGFQKFEYFEAAEGAKEVPTVNFN